MWLRYSSVFHLHSCVPTHGIPRRSDSRAPAPRNPPEAASSLAGNFNALARQLAADLLARFRELADTPVKPVVCVQCRRYAVENDEDRLTLDTCVHTDTGTHLPFNVLEFNSTEPDDPPEPLTALRPIKLSKFLWATKV
jgi:hypothetical protein